MVASGSGEGKQHVYVLFHETNTGSAIDESDGYVESIYATREAAETARLDAVRTARDEGLAIYYDPDDPEAEENVAWEHDWRVDEYEVQS